jgi:hypothetical protein
MGRTERPAPGRSAADLTVFSGDCRLFLCERLEFVVHEPAELLRVWEPRAHLLRHFTTVPQRQNRGETYSAERCIRMRGLKCSSRSLIGQRFLACSMKACIATNSRHCSHSAPEAGTRVISRIAPAAAARASLVPPKHFGHAIMADCEAATLDFAGLSRHACSRRPTLPWTVSLSGCGGVWVRRAHDKTRPPKLDKVPM